MEPLARSWVGLIIEREPNADKQIIWKKGAASATVRPLAAMEEMTVPCR
jgi:hypothetical protein